MLAIRLKRTGRSGHAQFRLIVQDGRFHPTRGKVVAYLGSYDPHQKTAAIDKELAAKYLQSGAQPSDTAARILKKEGVKLPAWVSLNPDKQRQIRHPEKLRRNRPADAVPTESTAEETPIESEQVEKPTEKVPADTKEEPKEAPAEEPKGQPEASPEEPADEPSDSDPAA